MLDDHSVVLAMATGRPCTAAPCSGVDLDPSYARLAVNTREMIKQTGAEKIRVDRLLRYPGWSLILVETSPLDPPWLFYSWDPFGAHPVWTWAEHPLKRRSGDDDQIRSLIEHAVPNVPHALAACVAYLATPIP